MSTLLTTVPCKVEGLTQLRVHDRPVFCENRAKEALARAMVDVGHEHGGVAGQRRDPAVRRNVHFGAADVQRAVLARQERALGEGDSGEPDATERPQLFSVIW